ncbi:hypothetical protein E5288_WYG017769 [Bos mutus]|uniref:Uncharacterized protein n=1 Tax=Bos mutus TaxID=72004 RepID=A0A6B0RF17_9CETA|nr:hypothetical protein [Bos mutus]
MVTEDHRPGSGERIVGPRGRPEHLEKGLSPLTCLLVQLIPSTVTLSQPSPSSEKLKEADFHRSVHWGWNTVTQTPTVELKIERPIQIFPYPQIT